mgnify:CR=1 FL=1
MIETYCRSTYDKLLVLPVAKLLKRGPLANPNFITLLSVIVGLFIIPSLYFSLSWLAITLLLISGYLDTLDGTLARLQDSSSDMGSVFDIIADRIVEFCVVIGLFLVDPSGRGFECLFILGSFYLCVTAFLVVGVFCENDGKKGFYYSVGLIERAETFGFFILMILFPASFTYLAWILIALVLVTVMLHVYRFCKH